MKFKTPPILALAALASGLGLAACSKPAGAPGSEGSNAAAPVAESPAAAALPERKPACELVTAAEMSAILGAEVNAVPNEASANKTDCIYKPVADAGPSIQLSMDWGGGKAAQAAMAGSGETDADRAGPYVGIGDETFAIGPTLMIRNGEDMMTIAFGGGVEQTPALAKKIFDTAKPRL